MNNIRSLGTRFKFPIERNIRILPHSQNCNELYHFSLILFNIACIGLAKTLELSSNQIGDIGAEKLAESLPNITNLQETRPGSQHYAQADIPIHTCMSPSFCVWSDDLHNG